MLLQTRLTPPVICYILSAAFACAAPEQAPSSVAEIQSVLTAQQDAWNRGDIDGFMDGYVRSDKLEFVSGGKTTRGWQTVRDRYHRKYDSREKMGTLTFSGIEIHSLNGSNMVATGRWSLRRKTDQPHGSFALIFHHTPAGWRIVHDETN